MPKHFGHGQDWWVDNKGEFWAGPSQGARAWRGFARAVFVRVVLGFVMMGAVLVGIAWLISSLLEQSWLLAIVAVIVLSPLILAFVAMTVIGIGARSWRPVRDIIRAAGSLADGDYSARVRPARSRAMRPVVSSFNEMAHRLESADEQRRRLLADLGHELRTPLTVIRGEIEAIRDGVHEPSPDNLTLLISEVEVMERLLEDLRTLSLIEAGALALYPEPTDIGALLEEVADGHRRRADELGVVVKVDAEAVELVVDPVRLREVFSNLVVNSLRAMPGGGALRLAARRSGSGAIVEVIDSGSGISVDEIDKVFDRFHKGASSPGSGLGLTISRDLVAAHGGTLSIQSEHGVGTTARVDLSQVSPGGGAVG